MTVGGVERALAALLNAIDYDKYDVVLWTKQLGGEFDKLISPNVEVRCWNTGASKQELVNDLRHGRLVKVALGLHQKRYASGKGRGYQRVLRIEGTENLR